MRASSVTKGRAACAGIAQTSKSAKLQRKADVNNKLEKARIKQF
jgi:hypothetical protein